MIRDRAPSGTAARVPPPPPGLAAWAAHTQIGAVPDDLIMTSRTYLTRLPQLDPASRDRMGAQLAAAVSAYVSPAAPAGTPAWGFLAAVLGERSRREAARLARNSDGAASYALSSDEGQWFERSRSAAPTTPRLPPQQHAAATSPDPPPATDGGFVPPA